MLRIIGAFLIAAMLSISGSRPVAAAPEDYVFEAVTAKLTPDNDAIISVRLLSKASGKPVAHAVIFQTRLDMSPDNMAEMFGKVTPIASDDPAVYRFRADVGMAGRWALKLAVKVPGEPETVRGEVIIIATEQAG